MWDVTAALNYLNQNVQPHSLGRCAEFVRKAIEAGGVILIHHASAKDYGKSLSMVGFQLQPAVMAMYFAGDVAIIQPISGHPHGHMAMFNGTHWISDFKQLHGVYPGSTYRHLKPLVAVYRNIFLLARSTPILSQPVSRA